MLLTGSVVYTYFTANRHLEVDEQFCKAFDHVQALNYRSVSDMQKYLDSLKSGFVLDIVAEVPWEHTFVRPGPPVNYVKLYIIPIESVSFIKSMDTSDYRFAYDPLTKLGAYYIPAKGYYRGALNNLITVIKGIHV